MNNTYVFNYTPLASNPDEFYDKFVITNPNLNHLYIRKLLDRLKAKNKTVVPKWNMYQNSVKKITAFSFIQNARWISKEYFSGKFPKLIIPKISNFDKNNLSSYRVSFQQQILKFFRKMSFEEKLNYDAMANAGNPSGYNVKLHREEELIIDRFICGESIPKISMDYTTTYKVIHKILIKAGIFYKTINARKIQKKQDIIDSKIRKKENKILLKKSKHEKQIQYKILNREIREKCKIERRRNHPQIKKSKGIIIAISTILNGEITKNVIHSILKTKDHNEHHLSRYVNFIFSCANYNKTINLTDYTEEHHICPKAKDLFPEYFSFRNNPWNKVTLTGRQHFIAHCMLWKAFGGSQTYAFNAMNHQKSKYQKNRYAKIGSRMYQRLKSEFVLLHRNKTTTPNAHIESKIVLQNLI